VESVDAVKMVVYVEPFSNHFFWMCSNVKPGICVNFLLSTDHVVETGGIASLIVLAVIDSFFDSAVIIELYMGIHVDEIWMSNIIESFGMDGNVMLPETAQLKPSKWMT
jgi:hypothetical protein